MLGCTTLHFVDSHTKERTLHNLILSKLGLLLIAAYHNHADSKAKVIHHASPPARGTHHLKAAAASLDKAILIIEKQIQEMAGKRAGNRRRSLPIEGGFVQAADWAFTSARCS